MSELARIPAIFLLVVLAAGFAGCGEDRSNLLPEDAVTEITTEIDEVQDLVSQGECFSADIAAERARTRVERLGPEVDAGLKKSLLDGVTQLQVTVKNRCQEVDSTPTTVAPDEPAGTTDTNIPSGTTDSGNGTTGGKGSGGGKTGGGDNGGNPAPEPDPQPTPEPPNPTDPEPNPQPPSQPDNGSGGVGPSAGG